MTLEGASIQFENKISLLMISATPRGDNKVRRKCVFFEYFSHKDDATG